MLCLLCFMLCAVYALNADKPRVYSTNARWQRSTSQFQGAAEVRRFIIDTDAGSDDAVGILHLLGAQQLGWGLQVDAIMAVNGNTHADNVVRNVLKVLDTAIRLDVPLYKGQNYSILTTPESDNYFGEDGFGDFEYPNPPSEDDYLQLTPAVSALVDMVKGNPGVYSLALLGPLTNVAMAIRVYPQFLNDVKEVFILGGSAEGYGNVMPGVEFNFYIDPEAAQIVLTDASEKGKSLIIVPCEVFAKYAAIEMDWRLNVLGAIQSPAVQLLNKAEVVHFTSPYWEAADAILAAVAADTSIATTWEELYVQAETCGTFSRGAMVVYRGGAAENTTANVRVVKGIDVERFKEQVLQTLNPGGAANRAGRLNGPY